jgi:hypothetical protein
MNDNSELLYEDSYKFIKKILKDQLEGPSDLCSIETHNWDRRLQWDRERQKYQDEILEALFAVIK